MGMGLARMRHCAAALGFVVVVCLAGRCGGQTEESEPRAVGILGVAISMKHAGHFAEAESILRAHMHAQSDFSFMEELGLVLAAQGKRKEAIKEYHLAIKQHPHDKGIAGIHSNLGLAYEFSKMEAQAEKSYSTAIRLDPSLVAAHVNLGNFYRFVKRDYKRAAVQLEKALELKPSDFSVRFGLAAIYADTGKLPKAVTGFKEAIKLQPFNVVAKTELAYVLVRQKHLNQAEALFDEVIASHPTFYRAHEGLARLYQQRHQTKLAEKQAKLAVALQSDEGTLEVLADIYQDEGDMPHAHKWWKAVLKANPNDEAAKHYLGLGKPHKKSQSKKSSSGSDALDDLDEVSRPEAVSHDDFMVIVWAALAGGAVLVGVALYSVHTKSKKDQADAQALSNRWSNPEEGVGLMGSGEL